MAKAEIKTIEIEPAKPAVIKERVILDLSKEEAREVLSVLGRGYGAYTTYLALSNLLRGY